MGAVSTTLDAAAFSLDAMLDDLRTLVEIESPSLDLAALQASAEALAADDRASARALRRPSSTARRARTSTGREAENPRCCCSAITTRCSRSERSLRGPSPLPTAGRPGPGVFDMLAGIVQALHGLASLDDLSGVELLFSADEEVGSLASRDLIEERALACGAVLVLEPSADGGLLKTGRKGCGTFDVTVRGRASHAGLEPEKGVNALVEVAHQVLGDQRDRPAGGRHHRHADCGRGRHRRQRRACAGSDQGRRARRVGRREGPRRGRDGRAHRCRSAGFGRRERRRQPSPDARIGVGAS